MMSSNAANISLSSPTMRSAGMAETACVKPLKSVNSMVTDSCRAGRALPVADSSSAISTRKDVVQQLLGANLLVLQFQRALRDLFLQFALRSLQAFDQGGLRIEHFARLAFVVGG